MDMNQILQQAQQMGEQLMAQQAQAAATVYEGQAGGGVVKISVTGGFEFKGVQIDPSAVDPSDVEMLEDLVLAALNDAISQIGDGDDGGLGENNNKRPRPPTAENNRVPASPCHGRCHNLPRYDNATA